MSNGFWVGSSTMPRFIEHVFPACFSDGASGFPQFKTQIIDSGNGNEQRNEQGGPFGREFYQVNAQLFDEAVKNETLAFWRVIGGRLVGFRFRSPIDWKADYEHIDTTATRIVGPGNMEPTTARYQLRKKYKIGDNDEFVKFRKIIKPRFDTVTLFVTYSGGSQQVITLNGSVVGGGLYNTEEYNALPTVNADVSVDFTTGEIIWNATNPAPPGPNDTLLWSGEFDVPVRFATDAEMAERNHWQAYGVKLSLIELLEPDCYA